MAVRSMRSPRRKRAMTIARARPTTRRRTAAHGLRCRRFSWSFSNSRPRSMLSAMSEAFDFSEFQSAFREAAEAAGFAATTLAEVNGWQLDAWQRPGNGPAVYLSAGI